MSFNTRKIFRYFIILTSVLCTLLIFSCKPEPELPPSLPEVPEEIHGPSIKGKINVPSGAISDGSKVWIKVIADGNTVKLVTANSDFTYSVSGLEENKAYDLLFTTVQPDRTNYRSISAGSRGNVGFGGWLNNVVALPDAVIRENSVSLAPLGTIMGKVAYSDKAQHYGIDVFIPGTGFIAKTDKDGSFAITDVPQGEYKVRYDYAGYIGVYSPSFKLEAPQGSIAEVHLDPVVIQKNSGSVSGTINLSDLTDCSNTAIILQSLGEPATKSWKTDTNGSFLIPDVIPGKYSVSIMHEGFLSHRIEEIEVNASSVPCDIGEIILQRSTTMVTGCVLAQDRSDNSGISVVAIDDDRNQIPTFTDQEGNFTLGLVPGHYQLYVVLLGYEDSDIYSFSLVEGQIYSMPLISLKAIYTSFDGKITLEGAGEYGNGGSIVSLQREGLENKFAKTQPDGSFSIDRLVPGTYSISVTHKGYEPITGTVIVDQENTNQYEKTLSVATGYIDGNLMIEGSPVADIDVYATNVDDSSIRYRAVSDSNGYFKFDGITQEGLYKIEVDSRKYTYDPINYEFAFRKMPVTQIIGLTNISVMVSGEALRENSETFGSTNCLLRNDRDSYSVPTNPDGLFVFEDVAPGNYTLTLSYDGYSTIVKKDITVKRSVPVELGSFELKIGKKSLTGSISREYDDSNDLSGVLVTATAADGKTVHSAITGSQGNYSLMDMPLGCYTVSYSFPGYETYSFSWNLPEDGTVKDAYMLKAKRGAVNGKVVLDGWNSNGFGGVTVTLLDKGISVNTEADGSYSFDLPRGNYHGGIRFEKEGFAPYVLARTVTVLAEGEYIVDPVTLSQTYTDVQGTLTIEGRTDHSGVSIRVIGTDIEATSSGDGAFVLERIPLIKSSYDIAYIADGITKHQETISVGPGPDIELAPVEIVLEASSVTGRAVLRDSLDHEGIIVTLSSTDGASYRAVTDDKGIFEILNVKSGDYTVSCQKPGWNDVSRAVSVPEAPGTIDIGKDGAFVLDDLSAPQIRGASFNGGNSTVDSVHLRVVLDALEEGSGIEYCNYSWNGSLDDEDWMAYDGYFETDIPVPYNGIYSLTMAAKDRAGNVSDPVTIDIVLTGQKTYISGELLTASDYEWTAEKSPYAVTSSIVVPAGRTLKVGPGTVIELDPGVSITVNGFLAAEGSESSPIVFRASDGSTGWYGIKFNNPDYRHEVSDDLSTATLVKGSHLSHIKLTDASRAISGYCFIESSVIQGVSAINYFYGAVIDSEVMGDVAVSDGYLYGNIMESSKRGAGNFDVKDGYDIKSGVVNNIIRGYGKVEFYSDNLQVLYNTFDGGSMDISTGYFKYNKITHMDSEMVVSDISDATCNSFIDNHSPVIIRMRDNTRGGTVDFSSCWWGENTSSIGSSSSNLPFIFDRFDDRNLGTVITDNYLESNEFLAGYRAEGIPIYSIIDEGNGMTMVGEDPQLSVETKNIIFTEYRLALHDRTALASATWTPYSSYITVDSSKIDSSKLTPDGMLDIFVDLRDEAGNVSSVLSVSIPYSGPVLDESFILNSDNVIDEFVTLSSMVQGHVVSPYGGDGTYTLQAEVDGNPIDPETVFSPLNMKAGEHALTIMLTDASGNVGRVAYTVVSAFKEPVLSGGSFEKTELAVDETVKGTWTFSNAEWIDTAEIHMNGKHILDVEMKEGKISLNTALMSIEDGNKTFSFKCMLSNTSGTLSEFDLGTVTLIGSSTNCPKVEMDTSFREDMVITDWVDQHAKITMTDPDRIISYIVDIDGRVIVSSGDVIRWSGDKKTHTVDYFDIDTSSIPNGSHMFRVTVRGGSGVNTIAIPFSVDREVPDVTGINIAYGTATVSFNNHTHVSLVEFLIDDEVVKTVTINKYYADNPSSYECILPAEFHEGGMHDVWARVTDLTGATAESERISHEFNSESSDKYVPGNTWAIDGRLNANPETLMLLGFERPDEPYYDEVTESNLSPIGTDDEIGKDAVTVGKGHGLDLNGYVRPSLKSEVYTVEFLANGSFEIKFGDFNRKIILTERNIRYSSMMMQDGNMDYQTPIAKLPDGLHLYSVVVYGKGIDISLYVDGEMVFHSQEGDAPLQVLELNVKGSHIDEMRINGRMSEEAEMKAYVAYLRELMK